MRRYDRELAREIDRTIRLFNNKIKKLEKLKRELDLPDKIEITDIRKSDSSKSEIRRKLREYQKYLDKGAEEYITTPGGVTMSRYELEKLRSRQRSAKISLSRQLNKMEKSTIRVFGKDQAGTFSTMGDPYYLSTRAKREKLEEDITTLNKDQLNRRIGLLNKVLSSRKQQQVFKENYMEVLYDTGFLFGIDRRKTDYLFERLRALSPAQLNELYNRDKSIKTIMEYYSQAKMMSTEQDFNYLQNQVEDLYDNIIDNIDEILEDYE